MACDALCRKLLICSNLAAANATSAYAAANLAGVDIKSKINAQMSEADQQTMAEWLSKAATMFSAINADLM